ncbi:MAG TPA: TetR/AcrR family transcriptional regulator [Solirubrobacterales bacterium]|nr:TetR/AcrR family transcriptional regulator [Solirubrobacterales bacterium]
MAMRQEACAAAGEALPIETTAPTPDSTVREGEMEGALQVIGEVGYRAASVRSVLEYSGGHRKQFYEHFESLEDCFAQAYEAWAKRLVLSVLEAAVSVEGWRAGVRAGLMKLFQTVVERPAIGRALFIEVHVAGGKALATHDEAVDRVADALDSVRNEIGPDDAPPSQTGLFVVGGIEVCVCDALADGDPNRIWDALPELMRLITVSYLDAQTAAEEAEAARAAVEEVRAKLEGGSR